MTTQHDINQAQYSNKSTNYLTSKVHANGAEFAKMQALAQAQDVQHLLDLGCGGGHVTYHLAPYAKQVTAYDLLDEMVTLVTEQAKQKGLDNVSGKVGVAEALPFASASFDMVASRFSAHHWQSLPQALAEIHRVLKPTGQCIIVDILGNDNPLLDTLFQTIEVIRDPSHVRDYSLAQWLNMVQMAGFGVQDVQLQTLELNFDSWVKRMHTAPTQVQTLKYLLDNAADAFKAYYQVKYDGDKLISFTSEVGILVLSKT